MTQTSWLRELSSAVPGLRISTGDADRAAYARDAWPRRLLQSRAGRLGEGPGAIAWPTSVEQVAAIVRFAGSAGVPLVPYGAGSGVCGAVLPSSGSLVVDLKRLARIRKIDRTGPFVEVEAGHMGMDLEKTLDREGFTAGHFPSSILCSTVGGWVAARGAGQCSGYYGKIEDITAGLELVTGDGRVVRLHRRTSDVDLVSLIVGSEGTMGIVTSAVLRLHPRPARSFGAWSFPTTRDGWEAMRTLFQAGLRPAVARLYDPFDALIAKRGGRKKTEEHPSGPKAPGRSGALLRAMLARPHRVNQVLDSRAAAWALGGAMLVVVFEGTEESVAGSMRSARALLDSATPAQWIGEAPARRWLDHRYAVSFRQSPVFVNGAFVDTMEVAAPWSRMEALYDGVRRALGEHVFVMAHLSHAYPDGCCIYFSFAGAARRARGASPDEWDEQCIATYDRAWSAALQAATEAGGTIAHHHGVGRSKAPFLRDELGDGVEALRAVLRAFDPHGIMNPGNLLPPAAPPHSIEIMNPGQGRADGAPAERRANGTPTLDRASLLVSVSGSTDVAFLERWLGDSGLTLATALPSSRVTVGDWLAAGAPGHRDRWLDPADQLLAGLRATLEDGRTILVRPVPRRSVGPDLAALFLGARHRFGRIDQAWLRVHRSSERLPQGPPFVYERDPPLSDDERSLVDGAAAAMKTTI